MNPALRFISAIIIFSTSLLSGAQTAPPNATAPAHPITRAQLQELLAMSHTREIMRAALRSAFSSPQNAGIIPQAFFDDMIADLDKIDFVALMLPAYQKNISEEDAKAVLDFYATPAGKRFVDASPALVAETQKASAEQGQQIAMRLMVKYKDQIEANARAAASTQSSDPK